MRMEINLPVALSRDGYFIIINDNSITGKKVYFFNVFMGQ